MELIDKKTKRQGLCLVLIAGILGEILTPGEPLGVGFFMGILFFCIILFIVVIILSDLTR